MLHHKRTGTRTVFDVFKTDIHPNSLSAEDFEALQFCDRDIVDFLNTDTEYKRIRRSVGDYRR